MKKLVAYLGCLTMAFGLSGCACHYPLGHHGHGHHGYHGHSHVTHAAPSTYCP